MAERKRQTPLKGKGIKETPAKDSSDEELPDYPEGLAGVQQAYADIQNIFSDVAREYPDFLKNDDEGDGPGGVPEGSGDQIRSLDNPGGLKGSVTKNRVGGDTGSDLAIALGAGVGQSTKSALGMENPQGTTASVGTRTEEVPTSTTQLVLPKTLKTGARPKVSTEPAQESPPVDTSPPAVEGVPKPRPFDYASSRIRAIVGSEIQHDKFAAEFIGRSEKDLDKSMMTKLQDMTHVVDLTDGSVPVVVGGGNDLPPNVTQNSKTSSLKLIYKPPVWPHQESLYKTLNRLPLLRSLVLDDSNLKWLRDLGSGLTNVTTLSVMRCGLKSLDGLGGLGNLEYLFVGDNSIADPSPIAACGSIRYVDLSENEVSGVSGFAFLKNCRALTHMKLMENPVSQLPKFHSEMRRLIPSLRDLRPRILEIHGREAFELYDLPAEEEQSPWPRSRQSGMESRKSSRGIDSSKGDDGEISALGHLTTHEGLRLRNVYNPARSGYKKRALMSVPSTVDEMDVVLEELESAGSSTADFSMADKLAGMEGLMGPGEMELTAHVMDRIRTVPRVGTGTVKLQQQQRDKGGRAKTAGHFPLQ